MVTGSNPTFGSTQPDHTFPGLTGGGAEPGEEFGSGGAGGNVGCETTGSARNGDKSNNRSTIDSTQKRLEYNADIVSNLMQ